MEEVSISEKGVVLERAKSFLAAIDARSVPDKHAKAAFAESLVKGLLKGTFETMQKPTRPRKRTPVAISTVALYMHYVAVSAEQGQNGVLPLRLFSAVVLGAFGEKEQKDNSGRRIHVVAKDTKKSVTGAAANTTVSDEAFNRLLPVENRDTEEKCAILTNLLMIRAVFLFFPDVSLSCCVSFVFTTCSVRLKHNSASLHDLTWPLLEARIADTEAAATQKPSKTKKIRKELKVNTDMPVALSYEEDARAVVVRMVVPGVEKDDFYVTRKESDLYIYCGPRASDLAASLASLRNWDAAIAALAGSPVHCESSPFADAFPDKAPSHVQGSWIYSLPKNCAFEHTRPVVAVRNGIAAFTVTKQGQPNINSFTL